MDLVSKPHHISSSSISIAAGITVGLIASLVQSLGITIQRKSHVLNQQKPEHEQVVEHRRPLWLLGFSIFLSSNILGSLFQIASLPVLILAPLGAVSLLWNAFFARFILGAEFSIFLVLGTILIAAGAVMIGIFGIVPEPTHDIEDLLRLFGRPAFVGYFSLLGAGVLIVLLITHVAEFSLRKKLHLASPPDSPPTSPTLPTNSQFAPPPVINATENTPLLMTNSNHKDETPPGQLSQKYIQHFRLLLAVAYSSASGIISGMCLLFAKSGVELLLLSLPPTSQNQFHRPESWALLIGLIVFALLQLWYLHKSLVLADPTLVCPLAFCFYNVSSIGNSLVYYDTWSELSSLHLGLVGLGTIILLVGVWSISVQAGDRKGVDVGTAYEGEDTAEMTLVEWEEPSTLSDQDPSQRPDILTSHSLPLRLPSDMVKLKAQHRRSFTSPQPSSTHGLSGIAEEDEPLSRSIEQIIELPTQDPEALSMSSASLPAIPRSPPFRRRSRRYTLLSPTRRQPSTSSNQTPPSTLNSQPQPTSMPFGTGFSIGLSPISPGFSLIPKRPGSVKVGQSGRMANVVNQLRMKRTLSEGDITAIEDAESGNTRPDESATSNLAPPTVNGTGSGGDSAHGGPTPIRDRTRTPWRWLKSVVRGKRQS